MFQYAAMSDRQPPLRYSPRHNRFYAIAGGLAFAICVASIAHSLIFQFVHCPQCGRPMHELSRHRETSTGGTISTYNCDDCDFSLMR